MQPIQPVDAFMKLFRDVQVELSEFGIPTGALQENTLSVCLMLGIQLSYMKPPELQLKLLALETKLKTAREEGSVMSVVYELA